MTDERKSEVNRKLAEFELREFELPHSKSQERRLQAQTVVIYTGDLNALVRLEAKLPPHAWEIHYSKGGVEVSLERGDLPLLGTYGIEVEEHTEAEARAEVICRYLEMR